MGKEEAGKKEDGKDEGERVEGGGILILRLNFSIPQKQIERLISCITHDSCMYVVCISTFKVRLFGKPNVGYFLTSLITPVLHHHDDILILYVIKP